MSDDKPQYRVPAECYPGVYYAGVGFFRPDAVFAFETDKKPSLRWIPVNDAAYLQLIEHYGDSKVEAKHGKTPAPVEAPEPAAPKKSASQQRLSPKPRKRAADSE